MITVSTECGLGDVIGVHAHLMVPAVEINLGEEAGALQLIDHWNRKFILDGAVFESLIVYAETPTTILFVHLRSTGGEW